ncbi:hypothetical protein BH10ACT1_BH10ACT1_33980 [soil metagenome]
MWSRLLERGVVDPVPPGLRRFVADRRPDHGSVLLAAEAAHAANAARTADLLDQAGDALRTLSIAGLRVAPLKGIDALLTGRYADPAARTMTDVDLLVDPADAARAAAVLDDLGYRTAPDAPPNSHQLPAVEAPGRAGSIELHTHLATERWAGVVPAADALDAASAASDGSGLRLTRTDSLTHLVLHAQLHDEAHLLGRLALRSLHETALALEADEDVDWDVVAHRFAAAGQAAALRAHLQQVLLLFGIEPPLALTATSRVRAQAVIALDDHPAGARLVEQAAYLPRALSAERMADLHGATGPSALLRARATHLARGLRHRPTN